MRKTKQTYVKPETEVVAIATAQILCGSNDLDDNEGGAGSEEGEGI